MTSDLEKLLSRCLSPGGGGGSGHGFVRIGDLKPYKLIAIVQRNGLLLPPNARLQPLILPLLGRHRIHYRRRLRSRSRRSRLNER